MGTAGIAAAGYNEVQAEYVILDDGTAVGRAYHPALDYDRCFMIPVTGTKAWLSSPQSDLHHSGQSASRLVGGGLAPGQAINSTTYAGYRATVWALNGTNWDPTYPLEGTSLALPALSYIGNISVDGRFLAGLANMIPNNDANTRTIWTKDTVNGTLTTVPIPTGDLGNLNYATQRAEQTVIVINEAGALVLILEDDRTEEDDDGINLNTRLVYFNGTTSTVIPFPPADGNTRNSMSADRGAVIDGVITIFGSAFQENIATDTRSNWRSFRWSPGMSQPEWYQAPSITTAAGLYSEGHWPEGRHIGNTGLIPANYNSRQTSISPEIRYPAVYVPVPTMDINIVANSVTEGPSVTTTATISRGAGVWTEWPLTVTLRSQSGHSNYATYGTDWTLSGATPLADDGNGPRWTVTIPAGQTSATVTITVVDDTAIEANEVISLETIDGNTGRTATAYNGDTDTVTLVSDDIQSNPTPTLARSGSGVTASPVNLTVIFNEAVTGFVVGDITASTGALSAFAGSGTSYSFTWTPPASSTGSVSLIIAAAAATAVDDSANSLVSNTVTISYDTQAPTVSTPDLVSGSDLGTSSTDDLTGDNTPTFTGTAEADATVSLFVDTVLKGTVVATGGTWSITSSTLTDGARSVTASAQDAAGNSSAVSSLLPITIDTVVAVAITTSPASTVTTGTPTWSGTCDAGATIAVTEGSTNLGAATVTGSTWSFTPASALADGNHTLVFTATDAAGATATTTASAVLVDAVGPVVALAGSDLVGRAGESIALTATYSDAGSGVASISLADSTGVTVTASGSASATVVVSGSDLVTRTITLTGLTGDGTLVVSVNAGTALDNGLPTANAATASNTVTVTVDSTAPADPTMMTLANASNSGSTADLLTNVVRPIVNGVTDSGTTVTIRDGSTVLGTATVTSTSWTFTPTADLVGQGLHTLTATATDAAGNASAATALGVTIDTQITIAVTAASITTSSSSPTFSGTTDANETVTITGAGFTTITTTANGAGVWSVAGSGIAAGTYALTVTASDAAANSASTSLALIIDQTAPTAPTTSATVVTNDTTPTLSGTAESGATITISQGATVLGTATATGGNWTFTLTTPLAEGVTTLTITATDGVGNVSAPTTVTVTIDVTAPAVPTAVAPGTVTTATPTLTGTAEAGATVVIKEGATVLATVTANGSGAWTATLTTLANGLHTLAITAQDAAGNISSAATTTVTVNVPAGSSSSSDSNSGKCGFGSGTSAASLLLFMSGLMFLRRRRKDSV